MKTVKLGTILENAARLAGRQVSLMGVPENWRMLAAMALGDGIRRIAAEKFPLMQRVEFRRYRPTWHSNLGWTEGQECWYNGEYYRLEAEHGTNAPDKLGSGWRMLKMNEIAAFIEFEQPWEPMVIDRGAVDTDNFAYESDPKQNPTATPLKIVGMNELGVILQAPAPKGVYVKFVPKYPNVSFVEWANDAAYEADDVVYVTATKECYRATEDVNAGESSPAAGNEKWDPVRISADFESYLVRLVAADLMSEDQGKFQTKAAADREFEDLCGRFHEYNGETRMRVGRFCR